MLLIGLWPLLRNEPVSSGETPSIITITRREPSDWWSFWKLPNTIALMRGLSDNRNWLFIPLEDLSDDSSNMAIGLFPQESTSLHPGDQGMQVIAERIWEDLRCLV